MPQTLPPPDEWITEIRQQWTLTPSEDYITISQDWLQEHQVNIAELSFDLHFPNVTQQLDAVQLNALDYDRDIDRETNPTNAIQPLNTDSAKEETVTNTTEPEDHNTIHTPTHRSEHQSSTTCSDSQTIESDSVQQQ